MIRRLRAIAPTLMLAGISLVIVTTAAAQAAKISYVTTEELHRFVVVTFLSGAGVILSGLAVVYSLVSGARDKEMRSAIAANTKAVADLAAMMREHHLDVDAHPAGSRARIDPVNVKLDRLQTMLTDVHEQAAVLVSGQMTAVAELGEQDERIGKIEKSLQTLLAEHCLLHGQAIQKRADDPAGLDPAKLRGKQ